MQQSLPTSPPAQLEICKVVKYGTGYKEKVVYKCLQNK